MEYDLLKKHAAAAGVLLDTVSEEPVDVDITLPDYCFDIERILKCTLIPKIYLANISDGRLNVEGGACLRVEYLDSEKGCIRMFEHTAPFSQNFPLRDSPDRCAVYVDTKPEYINCRAMSPRKLSLHGAFSLYARVIAEKPLEYCAYDGDELQVKTRDETVCELSGICRDTFGVQEDVPMNGKPAVTALLNHRLNVRLTELKAIHGKIMLSAEGHLELMYHSGAEDGSVECVSYAFPISHIVDCDGVEDGDMIDGRLDVMTYDLSHSDDALDGSSVLSLDGKLCFNATCWREGKITLIEDAFSTDVDAEVRISPISLCCRRRCLRFTDIAKENLSLDDGVFQKVIDVHCERIQTSAAVSSGAPLLSAKAEIGVLYENGDGELRRLSRTVDFDYNPSVDNCDSVEGANACVDSLSYRIIDERTLELRAEINYTMTVCETKTVNAVTAVTADDDAPHKDAGSAVILYYADKGEHVWDISKRFSSRPSDILSENSLEDEVLSGDVMLLIPTA